MHGMARTPSLMLLILLQVTVSAASLVVEIVAGRMLAPYVGMSLYTWTSVIAVVLAGFSLGHWIGGVLAERPAARALRLTGWTLVAAALTTAAAAFLLRSLSEPVLELVAHPVWGIALLTLAVFFLPSCFAGVPAPVLAALSVQRGTGAGRALGAMFAAGAIGAIAGTLLAGFVFISWLGSSLTLMAVTAVYALSALLCFRLGGGRWLAPLVALGLVLALAMAALAAPDPCTRESRYYCIRVIELGTPEAPERLMVIDHLGHGISARDMPLSMYTDHAAMLDALARIRAPRPDFSSFFIGGGSYSIPRAFALRGTGPRVVAEIDPEVTRIAAAQFWFDPASAEILHEDARRALLTRPERRYDVILGDAFTDVAVPAHLVTREFFELARDRLTPEGTYLMNVIDYQDRLQALAALVHTLGAVFPMVEVWTSTTPPPPGERAVFVLVAGNSPTPHSRFVTRAPEPTEYGALAPDWVAQLAAMGTLLTDDFAPIDRLIGRPD
ncbi:fused MFS/spermidine synthase [Ruegeria pomeroyi]|uniref:Fused MFS/spermidine synthase n=2 Tax=Ruegeria pomeroyi TaxID=89184 RepID=A0A9Q3WHL3_9RHOB|nr:fused MFS/spermidine synthase [Ruegeria pomeroyi]